VEEVFWIAVIAFLIAVMAAKRPHNVWMKTGQATLLILFGWWAVAGIVQGKAIGFGVATMVLLAWRTIKGWPEWWAKL
jgi:hypothetical protein